MGNRFYSRKVLKKRYILYKALIESILNKYKKDENKGSRSKTYILNRHAR